jgi:hypothetical protein
MLRKRVSEKCFSDFFLPDEESVLACRDGPKPLLSSSVPDLQLDRFIVQFDRFHFKIHADSGHKAASEGVISKTEQKRAFPNG